MKWLARHAGILESWKPEHGRVSRIELVEEGGLGSATVTVDGAVEGRSCHLKVAMPTPQQGSQLGFEIKEEVHDALDRGLRLEMALPPDLGGVLKG